MANPTNKVLICMDGSKYADYALEWYIQRIARPEDEVLLLNCVEMNFGSIMPLSSGGSEVISQMIEDHKRDGEHYLKRLTQTMKEKKLHGKVKQVFGPPRTEVLRVANEENVNVIITGSRGMGKVRRTLIGSVSDHVLHHSHVPVLICRHKDDHHHHSH